MKPEVIGEKYDKIADWWQEKNRSSTYGMKQIERAIRYCENTHTALDVGCGVGGPLIDSMLKAGFDVEGLDISGKMLEYARLNHPNIHLEKADICKWQTKKKYDLIAAWDSIFHLPMELQEPVVSKLCGYLEEKGILIYTFGDAYGNHEDFSFKDEHGDQIGKLSDDLFGYGTIGINENLRILNENGCKCMHLEIDQYPDGHVYVIGKKDLKTQRSN